MIERLNPSNMHAPIGAYVHHNISPPGARLYASAGQLGVTPAGELLADPRAQIAEAWLNVGRWLEAVQLKTSDVLKLTVFMTSAEHVDYSRECRRGLLGDVITGNTLVYVTALADPRMVIEIDVLAAA
jgi:2-iminobutanoate/2-iminopropanoate deaminase